MVAGPARSCAMVSVKWRRAPGTPGDEVDALPRTLLGRLLRATVLLQQEEHDRVQEELHRTGWVDVQEVYDAAFRAAVRRYFRPNAGDRDIGALVRAVRGNGYEDAYPQREAETMIESCFRNDVDVAGIEIEARTAIQLLTFTAVKDACKMSESEVDELIRQIEEEVFAAGHSPTMVGKD